MSKALHNDLTKEMLEYEYGLSKNWSTVARTLGHSYTTIKKYVDLYDIQYEKRQQYSCDYNFFKNETPESFYVAGFIAADGSIRNTKYSDILKINLSINDIEHLIKIKNIMNSNHPIKEFVIDPKAKIIKKCVEFKIFSCGMINDLEKFNIIQNKTFTYHMPDWLLIHPLVSHFMRGYFDGDGTISLGKLYKGRKVKQLTFANIGTLNFIQQYQQILINNCLINKTKIYKHKNVYKVGYTGNGNAGKIFSFLYKDATIYLDRKRNIFINSQPFQ
jgi:hypothetical protein